MAVEAAPSPVHNPFDRLGQKVREIPVWANKQIQKHWKPFSLTVAALGTLGGTAAVSYYIGYNNGAQDHQVVSPKKPSTEIRPSSSVLSAREAHTLSAEIEKYLAIRRTYSQLPDMELTLDGLRLGNLPVSRELAVAARQHLIDGLYLSKVTLSPEKTSEINYDFGQEKATVLNRTFDLNEPFQFQLLAAITELKLQTLLNNSPIEPSLGQSDRYNQQLSREKAEKYKSQNAKNERDIQHLLWLYDHGAPIISIDKSFLFLPPRELVSASQTLQALQRTNLPSPQLTYIPPTPGTEYLGSYSEGQADVNRILRGDIATHEIFHSLADAYRLNPENPKSQEISQDAFNSLVMGIIGDSDLVRYISARDEETGQPSLVEEYADRGADYKNRGDSFRSRIASLEKGDPIAYQLAKTEYEFYKTMFGGQEFTDEGELVGTGENGELVYKIGTRVAVLDTGEQDLGILLRKAPTDALDATQPKIYNDAEVEIIGGPVETTDLYLKKTPFYQIRVVYPGQKGDEKTEGLIAWVPGGVLGKVLPLPPIP